MAIHDSARPLVKPEHVRLCLQDAAQVGAAVLGVQAKATIKEVDGALGVVRTLRRDALWEVQTPQVIAPVLLRAGFDLVRRRGLEVTDDVSIVEALGEPVRVTSGSYTNIKVCRGGVCRSGGCGGRSRIASRETLPEMGCNVRRGKHAGNERGDAPLRFTRTSLCCVLGCSPSPTRHTGDDAQRHPDRGTLPEVRRGTGARAGRGEEGGGAAGDVMRLFSGGTTHGRSVSRSGCLPVPVTLAHIFSDCCWHGPCLEAEKRRDAL